MHDIPWQITPSDEQRAAEIAAAHDLPPIVGQLLLNRDLIDPDEINHFLTADLSYLPNPLEMTGVQEAVETLSDAIEQKKKVTLFGDYDIDGVTGSAILYLLLTRLGLQVDSYIPERSHEGYGLSLTAVQKIHASGANLLVTIDCGTTAMEEIGWATEHGMTVIVLDHHESPKEIPPCAALINPKHPENGHPDKTLCSAGLAFNLAIALRAHLRNDGFFQDRPEPNLKELLDLACLGTIGDMVPLRGQNRLLVRYGLDVLTEGARPGVSALKEVAGIANRSIGPYEVGFVLGPRINAAGRMDDAKIAFELLTTADRSVASKKAERLQLLNGQRQEVERKMTEEAIEQVEAQDDHQKELAIVVADAKWHAGVMGIVASRLVERYRKPAFVIALQGDEGKGSGRSCGQINLYELLNGSAEHLLKFGGHQQAAGLTIKADQVDNFRSNIQNLVATTTSDEERYSPLKLEAILPPDQVDDALVTAIGRLGPFGMSNPEPLFCSGPVKLLNPRMVGRGHLRVMVAGEKNRFQAIGFRMAELFEQLSREAKQFEIAYRPHFNEWQGRKSLELKIEAMRVL